MLKFRPLPPLERLNELFEVVEIPQDKFGKLSGLIRKTARGNRLAGSVAGSLVQDFKTQHRFDWYVFIDGLGYIVARVIYCMVNGTDPGAVQVDHKDKDTLNNNAWNLRLDIEGEIQMVNQKMRRNNTSGVVGVSWNKASGKWQADVRQKYLGKFTCKAEAARVVNEEWIRLGWDEFGRELNNIKNIKCNCGGCMRTAPR